MMVKINIFVTLLFLTICSVQAINWNYEAGGGKWAFDCDFSGNDIGRENVSSEECGGVCYRTPGCTRFTWSGTQRTCILKNGNNQPFDFRHGGVCGYVNK